MGLLRCSYFSWLWIAEARPRCPRRCYTPRIILLCVDSAAFGSPNRPHLEPSILGFPSLTDSGLEDVARFVELRSRDGSYPALRNCVLDRAMLQTFLYGHHDADFGGMTLNYSFK
jgi:hypothetical protein